MGTGSWAGWVPVTRRRESAPSSSEDPAGPSHFLFSPSFTSWLCCGPCTTWADRPGKVPLWLVEAARRLPGEVVLGHSKQEGGGYTFVTSWGKQGPSPLWPEGRDARSSKLETVLVPRLSVPIPQPSGSTFNPLTSSPSTHPGFGVTSSWHGPTPLTRPNAELSMCFSTATRFFLDTHCLGPGQGCGPRPGASGEQESGCWRLAARAKCLLSLGGPAGSQPSVLLSPGQRG